MPVLGVCRGALTVGLVGAGGQRQLVHHQMVAVAGIDVVPTAWAPDGTVEALEVRRGADVAAFGVQWHPELERGPVERALAGWLVAQAARRAPTSAGPLRPRVP